MIRVEFAVSTGCCTNSTFPSHIVWKYSGQLFLSHFEGQWVLARNVAMTHTSSKSSLERHRNGDATPALLPPSSSSLSSDSSFSSQSALLLGEVDGMDFFDRCSSITASPVTFMTDSNRSAPSPPLPPQYEESDSTAPEATTESRIPPPLSRNHASYLIENVTQEEQDFAAVGVEQMPSALTFCSSLFSFASTSTSSRESAEKAPTISSASLQYTVSQDDLLELPPPLSTSPLEMESTAALHPDALNHSGIAVASPLAVSSTPLDASATQKPAFLDKAGVERDKKPVDKTPNNHSQLKKIDSQQPNSLCGHHKGGNGVEEGKESFQQILKGPDNLGILSSLPAPTTEIVAPFSTLPPPLHAFPSTAAAQLSTPAAMLSNTYGCPSLSQLAWGLLCSEATDGDGQHPLNKRINAVELTWAAMPLPTAPVKKSKRKATAPAASSAAATVTSAQETSATPPMNPPKLTVPVGADPEKAAMTTSTVATADELEGIRTARVRRASSRKKRKIEQEAMMTAALMPTGQGTKVKEGEMGAPKVVVSAPGDGQLRKNNSKLPLPLLKSTSAKSTTTTTEKTVASSKDGRKPKKDDTVIPAPTLSTPEDVAPLPELAVPPPTQGPSDFVSEDWSNSDRFISQVSGINVSPLSQLSYLVAEGAMDGGQSKAMLTMKRRFRKSELSLENNPNVSHFDLEQDQAAAAAQNAARVPAANAEQPGNASVTRALDPEPVHISKTDDEVLFGKVRRGKRRHSTNSIHPLVSTASSAQKKLEKLNTKLLQHYSDESEDDIPICELAAGMHRGKATNLLAWWEATCTAATSDSPPTSKPCLWVELSEKFQETHGSLLRQLLVYWGCIHEQKTGRAEKVDKLISSLAVSPSSIQLSTGSDRRRKRSRADLKHDTSATDSTASLSSTANSKGSDGVVVLLCPPSLPLAETLRWWTKRTHVAHGFMPPLLAVTMTTETAATASTSSSFSGPAASQRTSSDGLLAKAFLLASCDVQMDPSRSLAVSCSAAGMDAFAQVLPRAQVYTSLDACADMLAKVLKFPSTTQLCGEAVAGPTQRDGETVDVGSLAAVTAMTAYASSIGAASAAASHRGSAREEKTKIRLTLSLQDRCFAELCKWNRLAIRLRDNPRRPQLLLHRRCVKVVSSCAPQGGEQPQAEQLHTALLESRQPATDQAGSPQLWLFYGLVLPATRNEGTFANTACREARLLARHAPPVTLLPAQMSLLSLFASVFFTRANYVTAVNVIDAHVRTEPRHVTDYISGYSCVVTGPMRFTVSATVRRYLHVRLSVNVTPLLALVSCPATKLDGSPTKRERERGKKKKETPAAISMTAHASTNSCFSAAVMGKSIQAVVLLARTQWRSVVDSLSCTCKPGVYERVTRTADGTKVCRHLAELFYYFFTQQFCVVPGGRQNTLWLTTDVLRAPEKCTGSTLGSNEPYSATREEKKNGQMQDCWEKDSAC